MNKGESLEKLCRGIQRCHRCERWKSRAHAVPGEGDPDARIFFTGEAPGRTEDKKARPFIGRSGHYLDNVFSEYKVKREEVYITSILKCYHPSPPKRSQMESCRSWLIQQIDVIQPEFIFVMGTSAAWGLLGIDQLGTDPLDLKWNSIPCIVTCHPAAAMRFPKRNKQFRRDFTRLIKKISAH